jgi:hypothetical protein
MDGLMPATVGLYRAADSVPCAPCPESEIPAAIHDRWRFMRRELSDWPATS